MKTKREKILVFLAVVAGLIFVTTTYLITPMNSELAEKQAELERLVFERMMLEIKLASEEGVVQSNLNARAAYEEITRTYPALMLSTEVDRTFTGLVVRNVFRPNSLCISDPSASGPAFSTVAVSMTLSGTYDSIISLINEVNASDYIRITRVSFSPPRSPAEATGVSASFLLTMRNPSQID
jgi:hypothetical protein